MSKGTITDRGDRSQDIAFGNVSYGSIDRGLVRLRDYYATSHALGADVAENDSDRFERDFNRWANNLTFMQTLTIMADGYPSEYSDVT